MTKPTLFKSFILWFFIGLTASVALVALTIALVIPSLPSLESLTEYRPKLPLRVYSSDGFLMAEFGEERRAFIKINNVPKKIDRKSTRLNSSHMSESRMPSSA